MATSSIESFIDGKSAWRVHHHRDDVARTCALSMCCLHATLKLIAFSDKRISRACDVEQNVVVRDRLQSRNMQRARPTRSFLCRRSRTNTGTLGPVFDAATGARRLSENCKPLVGMHACASGSPGFQANARRRE